MNSKKINYLWLAIFALLSLFVGARWNFPLAAWLAPIFGLRFYRQSEKGWQTFLWMWLASAVPTVIAWRGATAMGFINPLAEPLTFVVMTPIMLIPLVIDRIYNRRWPSFWVTLVYPIGFTAVDFFSGSGSPFGTFGAAGYSQAGFTALMQLSALIGLWGIPFIVIWFGSVVNYAWEHGFQWPQIKRGVITFGLALMVVLGFGFGRMALAQPAESEVIVGGFSLPENGVVSMMRLSGEGNKAAFQQAVSQHHADLLQQTRSMAREGADIVALQEAAGIGFAEEIDVLLANAAQLAQEENIYLVLPTATIDPAGEEPFHNVVRIIDPNGEIVLEHYKYGGTQFEGSVTGSGEIQSVETPYGTLSAVICWDADFPTTIKQAGQQEIDLLFVPSNDWLEVRDIHASMAAFRAVENGMTIFRQTGDGVSSVTDAYGRTLNRIDMFDEPSNSEWSGEQLLTVPVSSVNTLYPQVGDAFGTVMLVGLIGLVVFALIKRK